MRITVRLPDLEEILVGAYKADRENPGQSSFDTSTIEPDSKHRVEKVEKLIEMTLVTNTRPHSRTIGPRYIRITPAGKEYCEYHKLV